jgi:hypothetical protein
MNGTFRHNKRKPLISSFSYFCPGMNAETMALKPFLFPAILLMLPLLVFCQQQNPDTGKISVKGNGKGIYIDAVAGYSLPVGAYAGHDKNDDKSGFAAGGLDLRLSCLLMGKKNFGLVFRYVFQQNPLQDTAKNVKLSGIPDSLGSGSWTNHYLMGGAGYLKHIGRLNLDANLMAGLIISSSPLFKTEDPTNFSVSSNTGTGFCYSIDAGAGYSVSSTVDFRISVGYLGGTPQIHKEYPPTWWVNELGQIIYSDPIKVETKRTVSTFTFNVGLIIKI